MSQVAELPQSEVLQTRKPRNLITFSDENMVIRGMHERPLYFKGYIGSSQINRIQIDQGSSLIIMPCMVLLFLAISSRKLSSTNTVISGFNALNSRPLGKI